MFNVKAMNKLQKGINVRKALCQQRKKLALVVKSYFSQEQGS